MVVAGFLCFMPKRVPAARPTTDTDTMPQRRYYLRTSDGTHNRHNIDNRYSAANHIYVHHPIMFDSNEHIDQPLLNDDQPSWVTMEENDESNQPNRSGPASSSREKEELPKIILFMRLGNIGAAAILIFGSVRIDLRIKSWFSSIFLNS